MVVAVSLGLRFIVLVMRRYVLRLVPEWLEEQ